MAEVIKEENVNEETIDFDKINETLDKPEKVGFLGKIKAGATKAKPVAKKVAKKIGEWGTVAVVTAAATGITLYKLSQNGNNNEEAAVDVDLNDIDISEEPAAEEEITVDIEA